MVMEYHTLESTHSRCQSTQKLFDKDFVDKSAKIKDLTISVTQLEKVIEEKNVEIGEALSVLDQKTTECRKAVEQVKLNFGTTNEIIKILMFVSYIYYTWISILEMAIEHIK